jgi:hypothetical protein
MRTDKSSAFRQRLIWTLALLACCATLARIGVDVYRRAGGMRAAASSAAATLAAAPGARITAVVRLDTAAGPNNYIAEVLESRDGADYHSTHTLIRIALARDTAVIMGGAADVRPGAVVQVSGTADELHTLHAQRIVILSGYVRVLAAQS